MSRTETLAPIIVTEKAPRQLAGDSGATTKDEVWSARTTDGVWDILREEVPGTPWAIVRIADQRRAGTHGTLRAARIAIAKGHAAFEASRCLACEGSGDLFEERIGREHAAGHYGWRQVSPGVIAYRHRTGKCPCCGGAGRV